MKLLIASDIHGDAASAAALLGAMESEGCDKLLLLGDILYHGPRNDLPAGYNPKEVIRLLNGVSDKILAVRGNCDAEVDQMVLSFPIMADYVQLSLDGLSIFATHGHHHNPDNPPPMSRGEILLNGHTHVYKCSEFGEDNLYLNPGSVSLPKENPEKTYMVYENRCFTLKSLSGEIIFTKNL